MNMLPSDVQSVEKTVGHFRWPVRRIAEFDQYLYMIYHYIRKYTKLQAVCWGMRRPEAALYSVFSRRLFRETQQPMR